MFFKIQIKAETISVILAEARSERWHAGTKLALYQSYARRITQAAGRDMIARDNAMKELRRIFNMG